MGFPFKTAATIASLFTLLGVRPLLSAPIRVQEDEGRKAVLSKVSPALPPLARQAHISGRVVVDMMIAEDGKVEEVTVVSGNPILSSAVVPAAKKWTFQPFKSAGQPSKAILRTTFEFGS